MKKPIVFVLSAVTALAGPSFAGEHTVAVNKNPAPPEPLYGVGWYFGLQAGVNAYQNFKDRQFTLGGNRVSIDANDKVGFAGGIKLGYVFGTGSVRPAAELDAYYNGVQADADVRVNGHHTNINADGDLNSGAFLANFLLRFNCLNRFQPYIGAGVGGYYAQSNDVEVSAGHRHFHVDDGSGSGFAWQLIAGADYYFTEKVSGFLEYKFLNYEDAGFSGDRLEQHIVMLGARLHF